MTPDGVHADGSRGGRDALAGGLLGVSASLGIVVARWLTTEPYTPELIPFDVMACVVALALVGAIPGPRKAPAFVQHLHRDRLVLVVSAFYLVLVVLELVRAPSSRLSEVACVGVVVGAVIVAGWRTVRGRGGPLGAVPALWLVGFAFAVAALGLESSIVWILCVPLIVLLIFVVGVRRATLGTPRSHGLALVLAFAVLLGCGATLPPTSGERAPFRFSDTAADGDDASVVLIVLDTVTRAHLASYGYAESTMPRFDAWAKGALVLDDYMSSSSWTLPAHASIFTGRAPRSHGAHGFRRVGAFMNAHPLAADQITLAERARAAGRETGAVVSNHIYVSSRFGLDQGFDSFWSPRPKAGFRFRPTEWLANRFAERIVERNRWPYYRARHITDRATAWLAGVGDRGFFLFVNYMDAHEPHPPADDRPGAAARFSYDHKRVLAGEPLPAASREALIAAYDAELSRLDEELGRLLEFIETSELAERTTVFVTSDHGEYFGEHELVQHSRHLHESVLGVPLVARGPGIAAGRSEAPADSRSLHDAVLAALGVDAFAERTPAEILKQPREQRVAEWYAAENGHDIAPEYRGRFDRDIRVLRVGEHKLFLDSRGRARLFDLAQDPDEERDTASKRSERRDEMMGQLAAWLRDHAVARVPTAVAPGHDTEQVEMLEALGYAEPESEQGAAGD